MFDSLQKPVKNLSETCFRCNCYKTPRPSNMQVPHAVQCSRHTARPHRVQDHRTQCSAGWYSTTLYKKSHCVDMQHICNTSAQPTCRYSMMCSAVSHTHSTTRHVHSTTQRANAANSVVRNGTVQHCRKSLPVSTCRTSATPRLDKNCAPRTGRRT